MGLGQYSTYSTYAFDDSSSATIQDKTFTVSRQAFGIAYLAATEIVDVTLYKQEK